MKNADVRAMAKLIVETLQYGTDEFTIAEGLLAQGVRLPEGETPESILRLP